MSIPRLEFPSFRLPPQAEALRQEVRAFLAETLPRMKSATERFASWNMPSTMMTSGLSCSATLRSFVMPPS